MAVVYAGTTVTDNELRRRLPDTGLRSLTLPRRAMNTRRGGEINWRSEPGAACELHPGTLKQAGPRFSTST
jgi:hypothetical protein